MVQMVCEQICALNELHIAQKYRLGPVIGRSRHQVQKKCSTTLREGSTREKLLLQEITTEAHGRLGNEFFGSCKILKSTRAEKKNTFLIR